MVVSLSSCKDDDDHNKGIFSQDLAGTAWEGTETSPYGENIVYLYFDQEAKLTIKREDMEREKVYPTIGPFKTTVKNNTIRLINTKGGEELWYISSYDRDRMVWEYEPGSTAASKMNVKRIR